MKFDRLKLRAAGAAIIIIAIANALSAFKAKTIYSDIWQQLGISKTEGTKNISESFMNGYLNFYGVRNIRAILTGDRVALATDLMTYPKSHINSTEFKKQYEEMRELAKPEDADTHIKSKDEIRKEKIEETENSIRETEEYIKQAPDMAKSMKEMIDMLRKNVEEYKKPNSSLIEMAYRSEAHRQQEAMKNNSDRLKEWKEQYPVDAKYFVRTRLSKFLEIAKTVDFNAQLKSVSKKMVFVNPAYEAKSYEWKQIFRAGQEVIKTAIRFSEDWIKELNGSIGR